MDIARRVNVALALSVFLIILLASESRKAASNVRYTEVKRVATSGPVRQQQSKPADPVPSASVPAAKGPVPTEACGADRIIYPEWPAGFKLNVSAVFIVGTSSHNIMSGTEAQVAYDVTKLA
jgi:hypothetical protein